MFANAQMPALEKMELEVLSAMAASAAGRARKIERKKAREPRKSA